MEVLICSHLGVRVMDQRKLNQWHQLLESMDYSRAMLQALHDQCSIVIIPTSQLLRERFRRATLFLQLLQAQSNELIESEDTAFTFSSMDGDELNTHLNPPRHTELPVSVQLELARVRKDQIQASYQEPKSANSLEVAQLDQAYKELHEKLNAQLTRTEQLVARLQAQVPVNGISTDNQSHNPDIPNGESEEWESDVRDSIYGSFHFIPRDTNSRLLL
ncbi:unnamed protein product [Echinostoma caproni]|uniref:RUN domain-containing protein n=1 Tax=Echinostoma caproni TaxID=27848 RepID=A0A183AKV7_9TREM|nr:unnamed protein product [Echinostoma caproni]